MSSMNLITNKLALFQSEVINQHLMGANRINFLFMRREFAFLLFQQKCIQKPFLLFFWNWLWWKKSLLNGCYANLVILWWACGKRQKYLHILFIFSSVYLHYVNLFVKNGRKYISQRSSVKWESRKEMNKSTRCQQTSNLIGVSFPSRNEITWQCKYIRKENGKHKQPLKNEWIWISTNEQRIRLEAFESWKNQINQMLNRNIERKDKILSLGWCIMRPKNPHRISNVNRVVSYRQGKLAASSGRMLSTELQKLCLIAV